MDALAILDFGSQYTQLIARRVREANVYCELFQWDEDPGTVLALNPRGFILSGGPASVYASDAPRLPGYVLEQGVPVLGICYGMQLLALHLGGDVVAADRREYGRAKLEWVGPEDPLFGSLRLEEPFLRVWMSHGDRVGSEPAGFTVLARSVNSPIAAIGDLSRQVFGLQFHPEVIHSNRGGDILRNFAVNVCGCHDGWTPASFIAQAVASIKNQVGDGGVLCGLSGGVDSSVTASLVHRAVGDRLTCVFVDTGFLRKGEAEQVVSTFRDSLGMRLVALEAEDEFVTALSGVVDPEKKRRVIGERFVRVFEREASRGVNTQFLAQGTLYPDVIESRGPERKNAARIKTHHNVGGLPEDMRLQLVEPLRYLFKDEVRSAGRELGLPEDIIWRQPFPGPGLAVRILGEVTKTRLQILREADAIVRDVLRSSELLRTVTQQAFAVLLPVRSVGVMGDERTYGNVIAVRAVTTEDFMTADWARLDYDVLGTISSRIVNEVPDVNRVVYDITSKPPATIEWE
jgi:GMP synthase (glutamine-hydrolysing)